jgi:hypothetical protein
MGYVDGVFRHSRRAFSAASSWYTHDSPHPLCRGCHLFQALQTSVTGYVLPFPTLCVFSTGTDSHRFVIDAAMRLYLCTRPGNVFTAALLICDY